jgi:hypothetical protein
VNRAASCMPPNGAPGATLQTPTEGPLRLDLQRRYPVWQHAATCNLCPWEKVLPMCLNIQFSLGLRGTSYPGCHLQKICNAVSRCITVEMFEIKPIQGK